MPELGIAFIGTGDISLLHAEAVAENPAAVLVGAWDIDGEALREKTAHWACAAYQDAEALLADPRVDAVFVLTPNAFHARYTVAALEAGKHVLVEKPAASSQAELAKMKAAAVRAGRVLMPGHNYIHEPALTRAKELLDSGRLGKLAQIYILYNIFHPEEVARRYPGIIRNIFIHPCYLLLYLAGRPTSVMAMKSILNYQEHREEEMAMALWKLPGGGLAHFSASFAADDHSSDSWTFLVKLIGTEGACRFSYRDWVENKPAIVHSHTYSAYRDHVRNEVRCFLQSCILGGNEPPSTIDDAMVCEAMLEACERSCAQRGEVTLTAPPLR